VTNSWEVFLFLQVGRSHQKMKALSESMQPSNNFDEEITIDVEEKGHRFVWTNRLINLYITLIKKVS
jgi:hypothetical protein